MSIRIIKPGLLTTIQDKGRWGFQSIGVPVGGVMDDFAASLCNILVGNRKGEAVLEITLQGAEILFEKELLICLTGGGTNAFIDEMEIPYGKPIRIKAYSLLRCKHAAAGCRTYLAVAGGWDIPEKMGSKSTYLPAFLGGFNGRALQSCDVIPNLESISAVSANIFTSLSVGESSFKSASWTPVIKHRPDYGKRIIRICAGPEWNWFTQETQLEFLGNPYEISDQSNRIGYRLKGKPIQSISNDELISTAVTKGTIQVTPDGSMIILMADAQTTGGYPRIARVVTVDLAICAQLKPGESIRFMEISVAEAEQLFLEREKELEDIRQHLAIRFG